MSRRVPLRDASEDAPTSPARPGGVIPREVHDARLASAHPRRPGAAVGPSEERTVTTHDLAAPHG